MHLNLLGEIFDQEDCAKKCDNWYKYGQVEEEDVTQDAQLIIEFVISLRYNSKTLLQTTDWLKGRDPKYADNKTVKYINNKYSLIQVKRILVKLLLLKILAEKWVATQYSWSLYLTRGENFDGLTNGTYEIILTNAKPNITSSTINKSWTVKVDSKSNKNTSEIKQEDGSENLKGLSEKHLTEPDKADNKMASKVSTNAQIDNFVNEDSQTETQSLKLDQFDTQKPEIDQPGFGKCTSNLCELQITILIFDVRWRPRRPAGLAWLWRQLQHPQNWYDIHIELFV